MKKVFILAGVLVVLGVLIYSWPSAWAGWSSRPGWGLGGGRMMAGGQGMCGGWGQTGGSDYLPQGSAGRGYGSGAGAAVQVGPDEAKSIVGRYLSRYNRDLSIGQVKDSGSFYEVEVLAKDSTVFDRMAVDKSSGRIRALN